MSNLLRFLLLFLLCGALAACSNPALKSNEGALGSMYYELSFVTPPSTPRENEILLSSLSEQLMLISDLSSISSKSLAEAIKIKLFFGSKGMSDDSLDQIHAIETSFLLAHPTIRSVER